MSLGNDSILIHKIEIMTLSDDNFLLNYQIIFDGS